MEARLKRTSQTASNSGEDIDKAMKKVGQAMVGYFTLTAAKGFLDQVIAVRGEFQQLDIALQTMLGNKEKADKLMANVVQLAAKTPFSLTELGQGAKQLLAFKTPAEQIPDTLRRIGDVAAGVSVPVGDLISAYGKVSAKGKMQAEELNQFAERGVPIISELAKVIGTTDDAIYKMAEQGKIGFNELQQAIVNMTNEGGQFANMMEKQAESLTGQLSNLGDAWDRMLNDIGQSNEGVISDVIGGLTNMVDNYEDVLKVLGTVVATYGAYRAAMMLAATAQKAQAVAGAVQAWLSLASGIRSAKDAQIAFSLATKMNPWGLAAAGVAALVAGMVMFGNKARETSEILEDMKNASAEITKASETEELVKRYEELNGKLNRTKEEQAEVNNLISKLSTLVPEAVNQWDEYGRAIGLSTDQLKKHSETSEKAAMILSEKAIDEAKEKIRLLKITFDEQNAIVESGRKKVTTSTQYGTETSYVTASQSTRQEAAAIVQKIKPEIADLEEEIAQLTLDMARAKGEIPDYFRTYANLLGDVADKSKRELLSLQTEINKVLGTEIKDPGFKSRLESQQKAITAALANIKEKEDKDNAYDGDKYRKTLAEQKKAYDDYVEAMKNARPEDEKALEKYYANLRKQGDDYKAYLNKQLQVHKGNVDATAAIYQAAAKGGVILNGKEEFKPMTGNTDTSKVKVTDVKRSAAVPLEFKKLADYSEKAKLNAEKLRKEMGMLSKAEIGAGLIEGANAMSEMARYAGQMDEELGKALQSTADIVGNVGNVVAGMASGDYLGAAVGAVGVMATVSSLFDDSAAKQAEAARRAENTRQQYELQNRALEYQIELMNTLSGTDRTQAQVDTQNLIEKQIANLDAKAKATQIKFGELGQYQVSVKGAEDLIRLMEGRGKYNTEDLTGSNMFAIGINQIKKNIDEYNSVEQMVNHGLNVKNLEDIQNLIDEYTAKKKQLAEFYEEASGTTTDAITDSIVEGFRNGQSAADSLAEHTKDSMKNALIESFKNTYVTAAAANIVTKIGEAMTDGLVTQDEQDAINAATQTAAEAAEKGMKIYTDAFRNMYGEDLFSSDTDSTESGLAGGIRKEMTEETASRLAGLFNVMSLDTRSIRDNMQLNLANNVQQLNQMIAIELNTGRTAVATEATVAALNNAITELRSIKTNTSNNRRGEG